MPLDQSADISITRPDVSRPSAYPHHRAQIKVSVLFCFGVKVQSRALLRARFDEEFKVVAVEAVRKVQINAQMPARAYALSHTHEQSNGLICD